MVQVEHWNKGNAEEDNLVEGAARFSRSDAKGICCKHGRHTAKELAELCKRFNIQMDDNKTNGFAGDKAISFLNNRKNKQRTKYKAQQRLQRAR